MAGFTAEFDEREMKAFQRKLRRVSRETPRIVARALNRSRTRRHEPRAAELLEDRSQRARLKSATVPRSGLWPTKARGRNLSAVLTASQKGASWYVVARRKKGVISGRGANKKLHRRSWLWKDEIPLQRRGEDEVSYPPHHRAERR